MFTLFHDIVFNNAKRFPKYLAVIDKNSEYSYKHLEQCIKIEAKALLDLGLNPQQRVAIFLPKQIETVSSFFAATMAGGVFVPINPILKYPQLIHILKDCNVKIFITSKSRMDALKDYLFELTDLKIIILVSDVGSTPFEINGVRIIGWTEYLALADNQHKIPDQIDTDIAAIIYTSGSTGKPKGVVLSHRNIIEGAKSVSKYLSITEKDRLLAILPFSFDYGLNQLTSALLMGAQCVILEYLLPKDVINALITYRITGLAAVPSLWIQLSDFEWPNTINQHLRYLTNSGGNLPTAILDKIRNIVPNGQFFLMYGLTEAFRSTYLPPEQLEKKPNSIGKAIPNAQVLVVRHDGSSCEPNEPGELVHRGSLVAMGYWNDPIRTAERFRPYPAQVKGLPIPEIAVWSGDIVTKDEEGYYYFVGRKDGMIKTSGYRVSQTEIEDVIYATGMVKEVAAIGIEHKSLGQGILVVISPNSEVTFEKQILINSCKNLLPNYMIPKKIEILKDMPKNPNGKIDRKQLIERFAKVFDENG